MDRRTAIKTTVASASLAVCGCLSGGTSETEDNTQSEETNQSYNRTTVTGSNGPEGGSSTNQETGNITISVAADEKTVENFTQLELGIGKVTLNSEADSSEHRIVDTIDISGEPIKVVNAEQIAPGEYNQLSLTASIGRRKLKNGDSPYISEGSLSTAVTNLRITADSEAKLTIFFTVSKDGDGDYNLTVQRAEADD
ncbi:hypothetical protein SAMN05216226_11414 [Halovenus aranensis]|uniref:DUF4382 domain-containing protein n=1 Tax=Halovenus aranensis TaxID=890420 RepID=A0A1G8YB27_9EURY|nr:hypothetical protein [Halovenus aranensis]SDK00048.1 hypothetical protein SAMN05216226_11414 [Halovenus aranensis]